MLTKQIGTLDTPCFVFNEEELRSNFATFQAAIQNAWSKDSRVAYSIKTNPLPWILEVAHACDCMAEAVSDEEYELAQACGFMPEEIVFNGPVKSERAFLRALKQNSMVNLDSARELRWLSESVQQDPSYVREVGLRINIDLESFVPGETISGERGGRFGYCYENGQASEAIVALQTLGDAVRITGLHMHVTTYSRSIDVYRVLARHAVEIARKHSLELDYVDIGGGFFGGGSANVGAYETYAEAIAQELSVTFDPNHTKLIVEPGGAVVCTPGYYAGRILDVKDTTYGRFVTTDLSRVNIDHEMKKESYCYEILPCDNTSRAILPQQVICGFSCMESDRLCVLEEEQELFEGDLMVIKNAGAYSLSFTPGFFIRYAPRTYAYQSNGELVEVGFASWRPEVGAR